MTIPVFFQTIWADVHRKNKKNMPVWINSGIDSGVAVSGMWKFQEHSTNSNVLFYLQTAAEADQGKHLQNCRLSVPIQSKILFQNTALMLQCLLFLVELSGFQNCWNICNKLALWQAFLCGSSEFVSYDSSYSRWISSFFFTETCTYTKYAAAFISGQ